MEWLFETEEFKSVSIWMTSPYGSLIREGRLLSSVAFFIMAISIHRLWNNGPIKMRITAWFFECICVCQALVYLGYWVLPYYPVMNLFGISVLVNGIVSFVASVGLVIVSIITNAIEREAKRGITSSSGPSKDRPSD